jgi:hypothetical protein
VSEWIKVEDRLPAPYDDVIVYLWPGTIDLAYHDEDDWVLDEDGGVITHWMPLPQPPLWDPPRN